MFQQRRSMPGADPARWQRPQRFRCRESAQVRCRGDRQKVERSSRTRSSHSADRRSGTGTDWHHPMITTRPEPTIAQIASMYLAVTFTCRRAVA